MAKDLSKAPNIGSDPNYLNGNVVNDQTIIGEHINQDIVQFFQKLMALAELTPSGNFDNETNGYQFVDAIDNRYQQRSVIVTLEDTANAIVKYNVYGNDTDGYTVIVYAKIDAGAAATVTTDLLPTKYRPSAQAEKQLKTSNGDTLIRVQTDGAVQYQNGAFPSDQIIISVTYHTNL